MRFLSPADACMAWEPLHQQLPPDGAGIVATLVMTMWAFHKPEPLAALLLVPYLLWALFATLLTSTLINLNPQVRAFHCCLPCDSCIARVSLTK